MKKIYSISDPVDSAHFVKRGPVQIEFPGIESFSIPGEGYLIGTLEYFLKGQDSSGSLRLFNLMVDQQAELEQVSLETIDVMIDEFEFGLNSNIFLARLLERTNDNVVDLRLGNDPGINLYEMRARLYVSILERACKIIRGLPVGDLERFLVECLSSSIYRDGKLFLKELEPTRIEKSAQELSDFIVHYPKGGMICKQGDPGDSMYVLLKGNVGALVGDKQVGEISSPGEAFGEMSLVLGSPRSATLLAREKSLLYEVPSSALEVFHRAHPGMFAAIARTLANRIYVNLGRADRLDRIKKNPDGSPLEEGRVVLRRLVRRINDTAESYDLDQLKRLYTEVDPKVSELENS